MNRMLLRISLRNLFAGLLKLFINFLDIALLLLMVPLLVYLLGIVTQKLFFIPMADRKDWQYILMLLVICGVFCSILSLVTRFLMIFLNQTELHALVSPKRIAIRQRMYNWECGIISFLGIIGMELADGFWGGSSQAFEGEDTWSIFVVSTIALAVVAIFFARLVLWHIFLFIEGKHKKER